MQLTTGTDKHSLTKKITRAAIHHLASPPYAYTTGYNNLHLKFRTAKFEIAEVNLIHKDTFNDDITKSKLQHSGTDEFFDYWNITLVLPTRRIEYTFEIISHENEKTYYNEWGFQEENPKMGHFKFPFICALDVFNPPAWVKETVWYQIFPERFANGDKSINPPNCLPWGGVPTSDNFFGGDLEGVIQHIDHLVELGITGIYFTPIFHAKSNHKYDTTDYLEIDPHFGSKETLKKLINLFHEKNIKVVFDCVFNHSGGDFKPFVDVKKNGEKSEYKKWFHVREFPLKYDPPNYDCFGFYHSMPKLNTGNKETRQYLIKVAKYWIEEFDIDGWRLDVANEIDLNFWREFCYETRSLKENFFILGEVWHNAMSWLGPDLFDSTMNYPFLYACDQLFIENGPVSKFAHRLTSVSNWYPDIIAPFNFLSSHDIARLISRAKEQKSTFYLAYGLLLTFTGTPCIYYGDEVGLIGEFDPDNRRCMEWDKSKQDLNIFGFLKKLIKIRHSSKALHKGTLKFIEADDENRILAYERVFEDETILVVLNIHSSKTLNYKIPGGKKGKDLLSDKESDQHIVEPGSLKIIRL